MKMTEQSRLQTCRKRTWQQALALFLSFVLLFGTAGMNAAHAEVGKTLEVEHMGKTLFYEVLTEEGSAGTPGSSVNVNDAAELKNALQASTPHTVTLGENITLSESSNIKIGADHTLVIPVYKSLTVQFPAVITVGEGKTLNVEGGGNLKIAGTYVDGMQGDGVLNLSDITVELMNTLEFGLNVKTVNVNNEATITLNSATGGSLIRIENGYSFNVNSGGSVLINDFMDIGIFNAGGTLNVDGGTVSVGQGKGSNVGIYIFKEGTAGSIKFSGGTLTGANEGRICLLAQSQVEGMADKLQDRETVLSANGPVTVGVNSLPASDSAIAEGYYTWNGTRFSRQLITISEKPSETVSVTQGQISGSLLVSAVAGSSAVKYQWYTFDRSNNQYDYIVGETKGEFSIPSGLTATGGDLGNGEYVYACIVTAEGYEPEMIETIVKVNLGYDYTINLSGPLDTSNITPSATDGYTVDTENGNSIVLDQNGKSYRITGSTTEYNLRVAYAVTAIDLLFDGVEVTAPAGMSALDIWGKGTFQIGTAGDVTLKGGTPGANNYGGHGIDAILSGSSVILSCGSGTVQLIGADGGLNQYAGRGARIYGSLTIEAGSPIFQGGGGESGLTAEGSLTISGSANPSFSGNEGAFAASLIVRDQAKASFTGTGSYGIDIRDGLTLSTSGDVSFTGANKGSSGVGIYFSNSGNDHIINVNGFTGKADITGNRAILVYNKNLDITGDENGTGTLSVSSNAIDSGVDDGAGIYVPNGNLTIDTAGAVSVSAAGRGRALVTGYKYEVIIKGGTVTAGNHTDPSNSGLIYYPKLQHTGGTLNGAAPVPTQTVSVTGGTLADTGGAAGSYVQGATVTIVANPAPSGQQFKEWSISPDVTFVDNTSKTSATTKFTMPAAAVTAVAVYQARPGGGGSTESSKPTYKAEVDTGSGSATTLTVTVDKNSGSANVDVGTGSGLISEGKSTVITVPTVPDVDTYTLDIPAPSLLTTGVQGTLIFDTNTGSVTVSSNMLTGVEGISGRKAQISIGQGDKSTLPADVKAAIGDRPLIHLTLSIDGTQIDWSNPNAAVTVSIPYTPTADELKNPENIVIWYIDGSGNVITIPNGHYDPATGMVTFDTTHFSCYAVGYNKVSFNDVAAGVWYNKAVSFIAARGITSGTGNGNYSPDAELTRGEFLVMLMKAYVIAPEINSTDNFSDAGETFYTGYLAAAKRLGISSGVGNNMYAPEKEITRQEMFTLLYNVLKIIGQLPGTHGRAVGEADDQPQGDSGKTLSDFADADQIDSWAKDAMTLLVETGIVIGNNGALKPLSTSSRAEMAQVLYNLLSK